MRIGCPGRQGAAHGRLRQLLKSEILRNRASPQNKPYPYFDDTDSVVFFNFRMTNDPYSGIAAKIYTYTDGSLSTVQGLIGIPQAKREVHQERFMDWANTVLMEDLVNMGNVSQHYIFTNETEFVKPGVARSLNYDSEFDFEEKDEDQDAAMELEDAFDAPEQTPAQNMTFDVKDNKSGALATLLAKLRKRVDPPLRNGTSPMGNSTPELDRARQIVRAAMEKSIRLNKARLANPRRNHYGAKPGPPEANMRAKALQAREEKHQLLAITEEIVDAAALVSEADAMDIGGNLTRRDTAAGGYWMGQISREGTVPWGDDPGYKVC